VSLAITAGCPRRVSRRRERPRHGDFHPIGILDSLIRWVERVRGGGHVERGIGGHHGREFVDQSGIDEVEPQRDGRSPRKYGWAGDWITLGKGWAGLWRGQGYGHELFPKKDSQARVP
jgi:hypothetical protein